MAVPACDSGTLSWVRDEIDLALDRAGEALARHAADPLAGAALAEARAHLHQAGGALTIVGLAGVSHFVATLEARLAELVNPAPGVAIVAIDAAAGAALATLRRYLDELMAGHPDQPLRLFPAYRAVALAAGQAEPSPQSLFFPDLTLRPPRRPVQQALAAARGKALRLGFARGLAKWRADVARGLAEMKIAVAILEQSLDAPGARSLWWVALAWLDCQPAPGGNDPRFAALDRQFERSVQDNAVPEEAPADLLRSLLYGIAQSLPGSAHLECVRAAYRLAELVPAAAAGGEIRRAACRAPLQTAMAEWERFSQGAAIALMHFHDVALLLDASAQASGDDELARLTAAIANFAAWLRQQPELADAAIAVEVAGALVLAEDAIDQEGARNRTDEQLFAAEVAAAAARLAAIRQNGAASHAPLAHRRWREQRILAQVAHEIRVNLDAVEADLDAFVRASAAQALPAAVAMQLHQAAGALHLLGESAAARVATVLETAVAALAAGAPPPVDFAVLAEWLATLGEFVASLARDQPDRALLEGLALPTAAVTPAPTFAANIEIGSASLAPTLFRLYIDEARAHVATLERELSGAAGIPGGESIRAAHTLAGISAGTGLVAVQALAHALEATLVRHSRAQRPPDETARMLLARTVGALTGMVGAIAERRAPAQESALAAALETLPLDNAPDTALAEIAPLAERRQSRPADEIDPQLAALFLEEADEQLRQLDEDLRAWRNAPADNDIGRRMARLVHTFKGGARMCGAMGVGELAHGMETRIEQALAAGGADASVLDGLDASLGRANRLVDALRQPAPAAPPAATAPEAPPAKAPADGTPAVLLRVRADLIDRLVGEAGEMAIARSRIDGSLKGIKGGLLDLGDNVARLRNQLREFEIVAETSMQSRLGFSEQQRRDFDPLELDRFTRLQELTRMMAESVNDVSTVQHGLLRQVDDGGEALSAQARLNRSLSHALLRARMVPFATVAERLHRVVRQTAKELGRQANLDLRGGDTPVDRGVLERMLGPLEHLLRNAVAHGIETPQQRRAAGKAELGQITLAIAPGDNDIRLSLGDDGGGLDLAAIRNRAIDAGLLAEDADSDAASLAALIFRPGFSTSQTVSEIAGRGVGLDVVRNEVSLLGGHVDVGAEPGQGTRFEIVLPLTLAVIPVMLVRAGGQSWAIPAAMVEEARELSAASPAGRDTPDCPQYSLAQLLGRPPAPAAETVWQLLVKGGGAQIALAVDSIARNQEVVVKPLGDMLARVPGVAGATILPDGSVAPILNPIALAQRAARLHASGQAAAAVPPAPTFAAATVLVVDDSLTVRKIVGRQLERAGYRVTTAKDGVDALEQLAHNLPALVIADIEMPRMDGFELVRQLRANPRLAQLPVIVITSRSAAKHRQLAESLGVRHYLGKPYDEAELLGLIAALVAAAPLADA